MLVTAAAEVVRAMSSLLLRADEELALGATRNAAVSVAMGHARALEDAQTMQDLRRLDEAAASDVPGRRTPARRTRARLTRSAQPSRV
jgi:hypothetical protein